MNRQKPIFAWTNGIFRTIYNFNTQLQSSNSISHLLRHTILSSFLLVLFLILSSISLFAHICGPATLELNVGESDSYTINAQGISTVYEVSFGDTNISSITPSFLEGTDGNFTISGFATGEATHTIFWSAPDEEASGVCSVTVTVAEVVSMPEDCPDALGTGGIFQINPELCPGCLALEQINFDFPGGFKMDNTNWGGVEADPLALVEATGIPIGFLNIFSDVGWVVQNLSLDVNDGLSISTYFTLFGDPENPVLENELQPRTEIDVLVTYSENPLTVSLKECPKITFPVNIGLWDAQGVGDGTVKDVGPPPPVGSEITSQPNVPEKLMQPNLVNIDASVNQCFPMSVANSLQFLEDSSDGTFEVPNDHKKGQDGDDSLVGQLDKESGRNVVSRHSDQNGGLFAKDMYKGKFSYLKKNGLETRLEHKHQGNERGNFSNGDFTSDGITSKNEGSEVTFDWLRKQLENGEDVELVYEWNAGTETGSHAVRVVGFETTADGKNKIYYAHDRAQSIDGVGLKVDCEVVKDTDGDGKLNIAASGTTVREITFAMAESIIPCDFECKINSTFSGFQEGDTNFLIKGEQLVPINQRLILNKGESAEIIVEIFESCPGEEKRLVSKNVILGDRGLFTFGPPADLDVSPGGGTSPATFNISCKFNSPSVSVLTFHVQTESGLKILCGLEVVCNEGVSPEATTTTTTTIASQAPTTTTVVGEKPTTTTIIVEEPPTTTTTTIIVVTPPTTTTTTLPPSENPCFIYFSIEEPESDHGDIFISDEWGIEQPPGTRRVALNGQGFSTLRGGSNSELLEDFTRFPDREVGLDGFDIIEIDKINSASPEHKIIFTVEEDFVVDNQSHPLAGNTITNGDLLLTNGGVIRNQALIGPLDLVTVDNNEPVDLIGIDAVEVEGFLGIFDAFANKVVEDIEGLINVIGVEQPFVIIFSLEEINEEFSAGSNSLLPAGTLVSADDLIELRFSNGLVSASVIRSGADGVPSSAPDILEKCEEEERLGLDAACTCLPEDQVSDELRDVWFSTSLDPTSEAFTHGDILHHNIFAGCDLFLTNSELTGSKQLGLDALDFFPDSPGRISIKQFTFKCQRHFVRGSGGLERLILELGDNENCVLKLTHLEPGTTVKIATNQVTGRKRTIKVDPVNGEVDANGQLEFTISAIEEGIDWIAWAISNKKGKFRFNKEAYDSGYAWGMLVRVK